MNTDYRKIIAKEGLIYLGFVLAVFIFTYLAQEEFLPYAFGWSLAYVAIRFLWWALQTLGILGSIKTALFKRHKNRLQTPRSQEDDSPQKNHDIRLYYGWNWLVWWKISPLALEYQLNNYDHLKISRSARGVSFVYCVVAGVMTIAGFFIKFAMLHFLPRDAAVIVSERFGIEDPLIDFLCITFVAGLIMLLGRLIYKGHRWAIVVMMALSTLNMLVQPKFIIFWTLSMHAFYASLKVENMRRQKKT